MLPSLFPVKCSFLLWSDNDRHREFVSCFVSLFCNNFTVKCCSQLTLCVWPYDCPLCFDYCSFCRKLWNQKVWAFQLCSSFSRLFMATWISVWVLISAYYFLSPANFYIVFLFSASVITFSFSLFFSRSSLLPAPSTVLPLSLSLVAVFLSASFLPAPFFSTQTKPRASQVRLTALGSVCHCAACPSSFPTVLLWRSGSSLEVFLL